ncbi:MAG: hypothetical protein QM757_14685 [Paludibaculum sp.]
MLVGSNAGPGPALPAGLKVSAPPSEDDTGLTPSPVAAAPAPAAPAVIAPADLPPAEDPAPMGVIDPSGMGALVNRLSAASLRTGRVALGILSQLLEDGGARRGARAGRVPEPGGRGRARRAPGCCS